MARLLTLLLTTALLLSFSSYSQETAKKNKRAKMQKMHAGMALTDLPYTAFYSSHFSMGNPEHARMVLALYKDFENQDWSKESWFADTVIVYNADGSITQGRQQVLDAFKAFRESMSATEFKIAAVIPLRSVDRDEDWVGLWGVHDMVNRENSNKASVQFQTTWKIDKNNKVALVRFYEAVMPQQQ